MNLHTNIFPQEQLELYKKLKETFFISDFYLAGGTALALQIGHRKSEDFDFFTQKNIVQQNLKNNLKELGEYKIVLEDVNTLYVLLNKIKLSFITYNYPQLETNQSDNRILICNKLDIACMKLSTIISRGSKRDFIDLYFLLKEFNFDFLVEKFFEKYNENGNNLYSLRKSLIFFDDADSEPMPDMIIKTDWSKVKDYLYKIVKDSQIK